MVQKYTEARKEGNRRWDAANLDRMSIALPKGEKDNIKAFAVSNGESMNAFIARAIREAMGQGSGVQGQEQSVEAAGSAPAVSLDYSAITPHIEKTGESVQAFVDRAIAGQIERDNMLLKMGMKVI